MIKPIDFFKGDKIKKINNNDIWKKIKDKKCIILARHKREPYVKYAQVRYDNKFYQICYHDKKFVMSIMVVVFAHIKGSYKDKYFSHVDKELKELIVLEGI